MYVKAIIIEQLDDDGHLRTLRMLSAPEGHLTVAFADEYDKPHSGPFHFLDAQSENAFQKSFADCKRCRLPKSRFSEVGGKSFFKTEWEGIPTERNSLSYYALSLPKFAVPTHILFKDPHSDKVFSKNVVRDDKSQRFITYLGCRSSYGSFDFSLTVKFRKDKDNFLRAEYSDEHLARHVQFPPYEHLLLPEQRYSVDRFFAQNPGLPQAAPDARQGAAIQEGLRKIEALFEPGRKRMEVHMSKLTRTQKKVYPLLARGKTDKEIAAELGIATRTASMHVADIKRKLEIEDRAAFILPLPFL